jgi:hypothetical protein
MAQGCYCTCNLCFSGTHCGVGPACNITCNPMRSDRQKRRVERASRCYCTCNICMRGEHCCVRPACKAGR